MEWCSQTKIQKKLKIDHAPSKSLLNIFIEYAWDYRNGECLGNEDIELINWIKSENIDVSNENWFESILLDAQLALTMDFTNDVQPDDEMVEAARKLLASVKYVLLTHNLQDVLQFLMNSNDDVNYTNENGQTILHIFLEKYSKDIKNRSSNDHLIRLRQLMKDLVERGASFYVYDKNDKTPLHIAVKSANIELLGIIVSTLMNVNEHDAHLNTILHIIIDKCEDHTEYMDIVQTLVLKGANVNNKNNKGLTAVHLAAEKFHIEILKILASSGAYFGDRTNEGETPLHLACKSPYKSTNESEVIQTIDLLITQGCKVEAVDREGYMPLHYAAKYRSSRLIKRLVELGANVDCRNKITWITPLCLAANANRLDNISALVQAGADVNAESFDGSTPIFIAALWGSIECFQYLIDHGADLYRRDEFRGFTLLHVTSYAPSSKPIVANDSEIGLGMTTEIQAIKREKNRRIFDLVIDKDFDVNDFGKCGITPLHVATVSNNLDIIKILIQRGTDVNFQSCADEWTALHLAAIDVKIDIVKILIEAGANVKAKGGIDQTTPLHLSVMQNIDWTLGKYPCGITQCDRERSALKKFWPIWRCTDTSLSQPMDVVLDLIEAGADTNAKDTCRRTPLHLATLHSNINIMEILVKSDARVNVQDIEGRLPLHNILQNEQDVKGLQLLLDYGADINDIDTIEMIMNAKADLRRLVVEQAIKLKLIGLPIAKIYEQYIGAPEFVNFHDQCLAEANILKNYQNDGFSVYHFLHMNVKFQYAFIEKVLSSFDTLSELFPIYSKVIRAACRETAYRKSLLESARLAWADISPIHLPDVCVEYILSYLNNRYLEVFGLIVSDDVKIMPKKGDHVLRGSIERHYKCV